MRFVMSSALVAATVLLACNSPKQAAPSPGGSGTATTSAQAANTVARIVFVGQREACECTKNRITTTWEALEKVLADGKGPPVERIELDVDEAKANELEKLKPLMAAPGVYLLDGQNNLVKMLQGELTVDQIRQAIGAV